MTNRVDYIYQLAGRITDKRTKKKRDGQLFWQLSTVIEDKPVSKINVFSDGLEKPTIWQEIEENKYLGKEYLFFCKNFMGSYYLVNWQEIKANGEKN